MFRNILVVEMGNNLLSDHAALAFRDCLKLNQVLEGTTRDLPPLRSCSLTLFHRPLALEERDPGSGRTVPVAGPRGQQHAALARPWWQPDWT